MKENRNATDTNVATIEKDIINAQHFIDSIKTDKEYKEENGWHGYDNKEIVELARILEHILSDYKRVLKINEELKEIYRSEKKMKNEYIKLYQDLLLKENVIPVQKVKDKIRHYQELQDNYIKKYDEINEGLQAMINILQELLEGRK